MKVKMFWIPKSARGAKVARFLRAQGFQLTTKQVAGHHLCNVPGAGELDSEQLRQIAYLIAPELAEIHDHEIARAVEDILADEVLDETERTFFIKRAEHDW